MKKKDALRWRCPCVVWGFSLGFGPKQGLGKQGLVEDSGEELWRKHLNNQRMGVDRTVMNHTKHSKGRTEQYHEKKSLVIPLLLTYSGGREVRDVACLWQS